MTEQLQGLPEDIRSALIRLHVGMTKQDVKEESAECEWYAGIGGDAFEELLQALKKPLEVRILAVVRGGCLQDVYSNVAGVQVTKLDFDDIDGCTDNEEEQFWEDHEDDIERPITDRGACEVKKDRWPEHVW